MKLKDIFCPTINSRTKQEGGTWRKKELKKFGLTPEELMELTILKPKIKFYKKKNEKK